MTGKLNLDPRVVAEARRLAAPAGEPVIEMARSHTTATEALGVDRILGKGTTPGEVASYLAHMLRTGWHR